MHQSLLPAVRSGVLALVLAYTLSPLAIIFVDSLSSARIQTASMHGLTLRSYEVALTSSAVQTAFLNSLLLAAMAGLVSVALGFASARLVRGLSPAPALIAMILLSLPALLPPIVSGFSLHVYYQIVGLDGTMPGILAAHVIYASPVAFFLLYVAQQNIDPEIEECARNLGASEAQIALRVVLPQLANVCIGAAIICGLISWNEFVITWFVSGFQKTLPTLVYGMMGNTLDPSLYAIGTLITLISLVLILISGLTMRKQIMSGLARK